MKTIEDRAHDYFLETMRFIRENNIAHDFDEIVKESFDYAEAMQAEAEKRKAKGEWQPDWSQAPEWANYHLTFDDVRGIWLEVYPEMNGNSFANNGKSMIAPSFGYKGDWRGSLRKRP